MVDTVFSVLNQIGEGITVVINIIVMVISRIWTISCNFFGGGLWGQILTLIWMLGCTLVVCMVCFTYTINKTQSGIELFSASMMGKFIIAFAVIVIFIALIYITYSN